MKLIFIVFLFISCTPEKVYVDRYHTIYMVPKLINYSAMPDLQELNQPWCTPDSAEKILNNTVILKSYNKELTEVIKSYEKEVKILEQRKNEKSSSKK